jgi:hypothetical protein
VNELATIATRAASNGIPFLLGGGHAVITHGFPRSTFYLDLIVRRSDREKWLQIAREMRYELFREGPAFIQFNAPNAESFPLDLMLVNESTFAKLRADAVSAPSSIRDVWVVSLMHLDLDLPDWTGMDHTSARITPEAAFRLCEHYPSLFRTARPKTPADRAAKCTVEFVL